MKCKDVLILRELAKKYTEICNDPIQEKRRLHWKKLNSLELVPPAIYVRAYAWREMPQAKFECENTFFRTYENELRTQIFRSSFNDDFVFEPWLTMLPAYKSGAWGIKGEKHFSGDDDISLGAYKEDYPLKELSDIKKLRFPHHEIDEQKTEENYLRLNDAIGDILKINRTRRPYYFNFTGDISTDLGHIRGIENIMMDMIDNPEWLHELLDFMGKGILQTHNEAEKNGDWSLSDSYNQAMPYAKELPQPAADSGGADRKQLWCFFAAQELTAVSPEMHHEFMLKYQLPIIEKFGLSAYGCCEDLTNKIDMLRKIPNLRRIAVSPFANVKKCAEQIGQDYVISYRPSPADMVSYGFDRNKIRNILTRDFEYLRGCVFDITLKDVETVQKDPARIRNWVAVTRETIDNVFEL